MQSDDRYIYSAERRQALESLPIALAVYQYLQGRIITLLVSEGMCRMFGATRTELIDHMDRDMFGSVHPEFLCCICLEVLMEPYVRRDAKH